MASRPGPGQAVEWPGRYGSLGSNARWRRAAVIRATVSEPDSRLKFRTPGFVAVSLAVPCSDSSPEVDDAQLKAPPGALPTVRVRRARVNLKHERSGGSAS